MYGKETAEDRVRFKPNTFRMRQISNSRQLLFVCDPSVRTAQGFFFVKHGVTDVAESVQFQSHNA